MYKDVEERLLGIERGEVHVLCPQRAQSLERNICCCDAMQGLLMHRGGIIRYWYLKDEEIQSRKELEKAFWKVLI